MSCSLGFVVVMIWFKDCKHATIFSFVCRHINKVVLIWCFGLAINPGAAASAAGCYGRDGLLSAIIALLHGAARWQVFVNEFRCQNKYCIISNH